MYEREPLCLFKLLNINHSYDFKYGLFRFEDPLLLPSNSFWVFSNKIIYRRFYIMFEQQNPH